MSIQRVREEDEEGVAAESTTIKCKVSALAVRLVGTEAAGSLAPVVVVIETTKSKSTLSVFPSLTHRFDRQEDGSAVGQGRPQQKGSLAHRGQ